MCQTDKQYNDILFDMGNVLMPFDWDIALRRLLPHISSGPATLLQNDRKAFKVLFQEPTTALESGRITFERFHATMNQILGAGIPLVEFRRIWCDIFRMNEKTVALGEHLSKRYRTWLVSNTNSAHYEWVVEKFPRVVFYRGAALSYELGVMKPATGYYDLVMTRFGIEPARAIFIDDLQENVEAAIRSGMCGIVFQGHEMLEQRLRELGVV